jgi:DnaK suppressor protein
MSQKLSKKQLAYFKKILEEQLKDVEAKLKGTVEELGGTPSEVMPDLSDRATAETELNFGLRVKDREQKLIEKLKEALARIKDGSFGICERCGDLIEMERLKARPVATLCIDCKTEQERDERSRGE